MGILKNTIINILLKSETDQDFIESFCDTLSIQGNPFGGISLPEGELKKKTLNELLKEILLQGNMLQSRLSDGESFIDPSSIAQINFLKNKNELLEKKLKKLLIS